MQSRIKLCIQINSSMRITCPKCRCSMAEAPSPQRDMSNSMGFSEFKELWQSVNGWKNTFASYDRDRSGTVEGHELQQAFSAMGYNLSPQAISIIMNRYSVQRRIGFDDFMSCCIKLRALTDHFQRRDTTRTGRAEFQFDEFIQVTMNI
ncbi:sorcin-like [Pseudochaenichthys georgianus]|uniref:sorcin-like n=1 Tax=Pseudochaenichthys georgianus TaxID=52239 RepID=UPI0039C477F0